MSRKRESTACVGSLLWRLQREYLRRVVAKDVNDLDQDVVRSRRVVDVWIGLELERAVAAGAVGCPAVDEGIVLAKCSSSEPIT